MDRITSTLVITLLYLSSTGLAQSKQDISMGQKESFIMASSIPDTFALRNFINNLSNNHISESSNSSLFYYSIAKFYSAKGLRDSSCFFLSKALDKSSSSNDFIYSDSDFEILKNDPCWVKIVQKIDSIFLSKNPGIKNKDLAIELYHIYLRDQQFRSLGIMGLSKMTEKTDSVNLNRVEEIIALYGWPTYTLVGETAAKGAFLVIQHSNLQVQQRYLGSIFNAAIRDEASKEWVALLMDRISVLRKGVQIFGTQVYQVNDSTSSHKIEYRYFPIKDEMQVDSLRQIFGLVPLAEYYAQFGITYKSPKK